MLVQLQMPCLDLSLYMYTISGTKIKHDDISKKIDIEAADTIRYIGIDDISKHHYCCLVWFVF